MQPSIHTIQSRGDNWEPLLSTTTQINAQYNGCNDKTKELFDSLSDMHRGHIPKPPTVVNLVGRLNNIGGNGASLITPCNDTCAIDDTIQGGVAMSRPILLATPKAARTLPHGDLHIGWLGARPKAHIYFEQQQTRLGATFNTHHTIKG